MTRGFEELGRFAEPSLYILVSLAIGPKHGYAIMTDVEAISGTPHGPGHALRRARQARAARPHRGARARGSTPALPADGLGATTLETAARRSLNGFVATGLARMKRGAP